MSYFENFFTQPPEKIIEWRDTETEAVGWLVFNSLRGGAAGGGTRMKPGCTLEEVINLAKVMEIKFAISGPLIGGAKSGINYLPKDEQEKHEVLTRWFTFIGSYLKKMYGTGGDYNVDQTRDVVPILEKFGIRHPQEGIVRGHLKGMKKTIQDKIIGQLHTGVKLSVDNFFADKQITIADIATGFGVVEALQEYYEVYSETIEDKKIIVEGFGNVGGASAYFAEKAGAVVVGIIEKDWKMYNDRGIVVEKLYKHIRKRGVKKQSLLKPSQKNIIADVYIPAAASGTINGERLGVLKDMGVKIIVCGANNPFDSIETLKKADAMFVVIPDFVANAGMARTFAYLMQPDAIVTSNAILEDIAQCIRGAVREIYSQAPLGNYLYATAEKVVMDRLNTRS